MSNFIRRIGSSFGQVGYIQIYIFTIFNILHGCLINNYYYFERLSFSLIIIYITRLGNWEYFFFLEKEALINEF